MADIDLEHGDPGRADSDTPTARRRRRRAETSGSTASDRKTDSEIRAGLEKAFDGLAKARYARDDDELGDALTEEAPAMTEGIVTLTDAIPFARPPIIIGLHLIIVLLAFGRVGGILFDRARQRRADRQQEQQEQEQAGHPLVEVQQ